MCCCMAPTSHELLQECHIALQVHGLLHIFEQMQTEADSSNSGCSGQRPGNLSALKYVVLEQLLRWAVARLIKPAVC